MHEPGTAGAAKQAYLTMNRWLQLPLAPVLRALGAPPPLATEPVDMCMTGEQVAGCILVLGLPLAHR